MGSPFEPELLEVLGGSPDLLDTFLKSVDPVYDLCLIRSAAEDLRREADEQAKRAGQLPDHIQWMSSHGYSREDCRQVRYVVEAFHSLEPIFAVMTAVTLRWLSRRRVATLEQIGECRGTRGEFRGPIQFAAEEDVPAVIMANVRKPGRPPHLLYRALAVWPDYAGAAWNDLRASIGGGLAASVEALRSTAQDISIPIADALRAGPPRTAPRRLKPSLESVLWDSCQAITVASALRRGLVRAEIRARARNARRA